MSLSATNRTTAGTQKTELAKQFLSALRNRDWDLLRSLLADNVTWSLPSLSRTIILIVCKLTKYIKPKLSIILAGAVALTAPGCVSSSVVPIGANTLQPLPEDEPVQIYFDDAQVKKQFTVIAMVSHSDRGKYRILSLQDVVPALKNEARRAGANGLIITHTQAMRSGMWSTGLAVDAKAIHIGP